MKAISFGCIICYDYKQKSRSISFACWTLIKETIFSHGQFYVAASRVTNRKRLKILTCGKDGELTNSTANVVFKEVFQDLD